jgi:putative membrane protein
MRRTAVVAALVVAATSAIVVANRASARPAVELDDPTIVAIFDAANTADIETGALGAERASTKEVRDYGTMLSQVHVAVRQKGRELAQKLGVTPTPPKDDQAARDHAAVMARLRSLKGAEFERAFLQHEQAFHAAVLAAVKGTLLPAIQNAELKAFVVSLAPAFEAHRLAAENLLKKTQAAD